MIEAQYEADRSLLGLGRTTESLLSYRISHVTRDILGIAFTFHSDGGVSNSTADR